MKTQGGVRRESRVMRQDMVKAFGEATRSIGPYPVTHTMWLLIAAFCILTMELLCKIVLLRMRRKPHMEVLGL